MFRQHTWKWKCLRPLFNTVIRKRMVTIRNKYLQGTHKLDRQFNHSLKKDILEIIVFVVG